VPGLAPTAAGPGALAPRTGVALRLDGGEMPADVGDRALSEWCLEHLGAPVTGRVFTAGHLSGVYGLRLAGGRAVVLKVRGGGVRLGACVRVQRRMWEAGFCCPEPLAGPHGLGSAVATAEALLPSGGQPALQDAPRLFAGLLARFVECGAGLAPEPDLRPAPAWVCWYHQEDGVWPVPDDRDADLNAEHCPVTAWLDELGAAVRERLGEVRDAACVIGHGDWHGGNVMFLDGRPLAVHDWDSVLYEPEVVIAGQAAAVFQDGRTGGSASAGQSGAFLEAYQSARGRTFSRAELQLSWAAGLWVLAFNARKLHLDGVDVLGRADAESRMRLAGI
jgi:Phosphotransferase enzyme family